ncbi:DNA-directed primase/polymerase protein [Gastrophryne carolinensis]
MKRKWIKTLKNVEELASHYKRHPLNSPYKPKLARPWQPSSVWRLFHRQAAALQFAKTCKEDVHIFALETVLHETERRLYLVTTYTEFWFYYSKHPQTLGHCYEVIPADTVCKLYFDLEFYKSENPNADGIQMVAQLITFFCQKLEEWYGVTCSADCVINLDSSTHEKFSRHLIFVLPNAAFKDNIHVGNFIKAALRPLLPASDSRYNGKAPGSSVTSTDAEICDTTGKSPCEISAKGTYNDLPSVITQSSDPSPFLICKNGEKQPFIDLGVYTKNRNFRLYKSSKLGKTAVFELAEDNKFSRKAPKYMSADEHIFLCSLISNVRFTDNLRILTCGDTIDRIASSCVNTRGLLSSDDIINGYRSSPYPEIDHFILSLVTREGFQGGIRHWNYFSVEELLVYDTTNYRWCENVGRAHKSNNVMLLVDLKKEVWYQKCHDPVCRAKNFKSYSYPLPTEVCLYSIFKGDGEDWSLTMDENGNIQSTPTTSNTKESVVISLSEQHMEPVVRDWDDDIDDVCITEAAEDAELADLADVSIAEWELEHTDIPDELLLQAVDELEAFVET